MSAPIRSVSTETLTVTEIVHKLRRNHFLIPTFQRDFVWEPDDVLSLWESMYHAFPIGSVICWNTSEQLETHRRIGGFTLEPNALDQHDESERRYILDGQQRLTSLFISYIAGSAVVGDEPFNFDLHFDPTASDAIGTDRREGVFLFANAVGRRRHELGRKQISPELIVRVGDEDALVPERLAAYATLPGYTPEVRARLNRLYRLLQLYRIPFIFTQGATLADVCEIYERINQKGRKLTTSDIVVARTFRGGAHGFSLRAMFEEIRDGLSERSLRWRQIDQQMLLQMIGVCLRVEHSRAGRNPYGFDKAALLNLTPAAIQPYKERIQRAIIATIEFLVAQGIYSVARLPANYLVLPLCAYLYLRPDPDEQAMKFMRQWLWRSAFDHDSIDSDADVYTAIKTFVEPLSTGRQPTFDPLTLSLGDFIRWYRQDHSFRRAMLAFLASLGPRDLADGHVVTDSPAMTAAGSDATQHHIFPLAFLTKQRASTTAFHKDSVMNLCWMSQQTNFNIKDTSPAEYFGWYRDRPKGKAEGQREASEEKPEKKLTFEEILESQLIPLDFANRPTFQKADYRAFLFARARLFAARLRAALPDVPITIVDR
jgi:hypothetical protein